MFKEATVKRVTREGWANVHISNQSECKQLAWHRIAQFFPLAEFWLVSLNFSSSRRMQGWSNEYNIMQQAKCCTKIFDRFQIWSNIIQHVATYRNRVAKRMQHAVPNNVARCCVEMLRAFVQGFREFQQRRWLRLRHRHNTIISLVKRGKRIVLHVQHAFYCCTLWNHQIWGFNYNVSIQMQIFHYLFSFWNCSYKIRF